MKSKPMLPKRMPTTDLYTQQVSEAEIQFIAQLIWKQPTVVDVWLFGSAARGETKSGERGYRHPSDIDVLVIASCEEAEKIQIAAAIYKEIARSHFMRPVDVIVWTELQWETREMHALGRRVAGEGIRLEKKDVSEQV